MAYDIEGRLLEVCTCNVLCPCWVGEDPDYKTCDTTIAWGIEKGTIEGVDVGGLTIAVSAHIPEQHPDPEVVEGGRLRRRSIDRRAAGRPAPAVHRTAGRRRRRPGRPDRRGRRRRARPDHVQRPRRQGPADARLDRRSRHGPVRRRDRQADDPRGDRLQHDPGLPGVRRQGEPVHGGTAAATASRASTCRVTTPSRATSASPPDAGRTDDVRGRATSATRGAIGRSSPDRSSRCPALAWLRLWRLVGLAVGPLPPPRGRHRTAPARGAPLLARLGADDRRDDAAVERAAGPHVRGARRPAAATAAPRRAPAARGYLVVWAALRARGLGPGPRHPCRRRRARPGWRRIPS